MLRDSVSGRRVVQLTNYRGHSHHLAGANPCWLAGGERLVVVSNRDGCGNLHAYDFSAGTLLQLTDLRGAERPRSVQRLDETRLAFWYGAESFELELKTFRIRSVGALPTEDIVQSPTVAGDALLPDGRCAIWISGSTVAVRDRRVLAVTGSGREPFAVAAPCLRPGTEQVVFASDAGGYVQLYLAEGNRPTELPLLSDVRRGGAVRRGRPETHVG